ncbi:MAG: N-acetylmuramoyl-L-alanine amidase [Bacteroidota bacterium]
MMKRFSVICCVIAIIIIGSAFSSHPPVHTGPGKLSAIKTVIIDPGHGGLYPGTRGLISTEKNVTLEVSLKLGEAIKNAFPDIRVVYTRTTDDCSGNATNLRDDLQNRARIANDSKGDLFISIHCNATRQPAGGWYAKRVIGHRRKTVMVGRGKKKRKKSIMEPIYESYWVKNTRIGTETYIWKAAKQEDKYKAINRNDETSGENLEDSTAEASAFNSDSPEWIIRTQLYEKRFFTNSYILSSMVEDEFKNSGRVSYGVKQRDVGIQVLQATGMPSILVEIGFLSNKEEEEYLNSNKGQDEVVTDIVEAFRKYKQVNDGKGGARSASGNQ